jgi:hypothetical protein
MMMMTTMMMVVSGVKVVLRALVLLPRVL